MAKGRDARRETKKPRKKEDKKVLPPSTEFVSPEVEIIGKRKKPKE